MLLDADEATHRGDVQHEQIPEKLIPGDELGQLMRSRNAAIAQLRKHEADLERAAKQLADQDRLASLGLLSAGIAHEINTPLAVLQGSIEQLNETVIDPDARQRLARMARVAERLRKIGSRLLDFARPPRETSQPVPLRPIVEEAWGLVSIDDKAAGVRFVDSAPEDLAVLGDADRLVQVFVNLLRNSLAAVGRDGLIAVEARRRKEWVEIAVEDDGPGIPDETLPHIFDAFVSSRLDASGTGLGLTVAEGIVRQHGGAISAVNRPQRGARIEIRLPSAERVA
jgi:signal transduction histidine kinase